MKKITVSRTINASVLDVWNLFVNFDLVYKFHPMVETSPLEGSIRSGNGTQRICYMYNGMKAKEQIIDLKQYEYLCVEVVESPMPFSEVYVEFHFSKINDKATEVKVVMSLEPKFGRLGRLLFSLMMKKQLTMMLTSTLKGLNDYLTEGRIVGKNGLLMDRDPDFSSACQI